MVAVVLGQLPDRIWQDLDFEELDGVIRAYAELHGARQGTEPIDDFDRELIADAKSALAASQAAAPQ
jgi:hypothetical protein